MEKQRTDLARDLEDLGDRLEEAGGATVAQVQPRYITCISQSIQHEVANMLFKLVLLGINYIDGTVTLTAGLLVNCMPFCAKGCFLGMDSVNCEVLCFP